MCKVPFETQPMTQDEAGKGQETVIVHTCKLMQKAMTQIVTSVGTRWDCHTIVSTLIEAPKAIYLYDVTKGSVYTPNYEM